MRRAWLFGLLLGCAHPQVTARPTLPPSNEMVVPRPVSHAGREYRRLHLRFVGAERVRVSEIAHELRCVHGEVDAAVLEYDRLVIIGWYLDHGHVAAKIEGTAVADTGDALTVTFTIFEGPVYRVGVLDVADAFGGPALGWKPPFDPGETFSRIALIRALDRVRRTYRDLGYASMNADPVTDVDDGRREISIRVRVARGPITFLEAVEIRGLSTIPEPTVAQQLLVRPGDRYNETALEGSKKKLLDTAWFTRVDLSILPGTRPDLVKFVVEVAERPKSSPGVYTLR